MKVRQISSPGNDYIKYLVKLKDRRFREKEQRFLIEGEKELSRALAAGIKLEHLLYAPKLLNAEAKMLLAACPDATELTEVSQGVFEKLSLRQNPDGLLALAAMREHSPDDLKLSKNPLLLVIDGLEKPGNVGALLRTADAVNVDAILLSGRGTDIYNPNVIRSSVGSVFSRPVIALEASELLAYLKTQGIKLVATSPGGSRPFWDEDYRQASAILLGTEHDGLAEHWFDAADVKVSIPMHGMADSLNVATSGALLLYEVLRQRRALEKPG